MPLLSTVALLVIARAFLRRQARLTRTAQQAARQVWRGVQPGDLDRSWGRVADQMTIAVAGAQLVAAQAAEPYLDEVLAAQGADNDREHAFQPRALAGVASDGRRLDTLLLTPIVEVKMAIATPGVTSDMAMARGEASLLRIVGTQIPDAERVATGVLVAATPSVTKWVRMINPGACGRCAILAGRVYRFSKGFERHPGCLCTMIPLSENVENDLTTNPRAYFDSLTREQQNKRFGVSRTDRILAGEDMNKVVNSGRRSTRTASVRPRPVGRVEPGWDADQPSSRAAPSPSRSRTARSARARAEAKPMPEQVVSGNVSKEEAIAALRAAGFLS